MDTLAEQQALISFSVRSSTAWSWQMRKSSARAWARYSTDSSNKVMVLSLLLFFPSAHVGHPVGAGHAHQLPLAPEHRVPSVLLLPANRAYGGRSRRLYIAEGRQQTEIPITLVGHHLLSAPGGRGKNLKKMKKQVDKVYTFW